MRYAIVSDLHANLQAWQAVLLDIRSSRCDRIICLGDVVGYGPSPAEVLESVNSTVDYFVLGNHDAAYSGQLSDELFSDEARVGLDWTRKHLAARAAAWFRDVPLVLHGEGFRCAHGDHAEPGRFRYVIEAQEALPSWQASTDPLLFVGHTHRPALFVIGQSGTPHALEAQDFVLEDGKRFIVNPGSVGLSRDGDVRASYCIFDVDERSVYWRRVPFDLDAFAAALAGAGLKETTSWFLEADPRAARPALRTMLGFAPSTAPGAAVRDAVPVREIDVLQGKVRTWRRLASLAAAAIIVCGTAASGYAVYRQRAAVRFEPLGSFSPVAAIAEPGTELLPPLRSPTGLPPFEGWSLSLGNRYAQSAAIAGDGNGLALSSTAGGSEVRLAGPMVAAAPDLSLCAEGLFRKSDDFSGTVALVVSAQRRVGGRTEWVDQLVVKEPNQARREGWMLAKQTFTLPAGAEWVQVSVRGRFAGRLDVRELSLTLK